MVPYCSFIELNVLLVWRLMLVKLVKKTRETCCNSRCSFEYVTLLWHVPPISLEVFDSSWWSQLVCVTHLRKTPWGHPNFLLDAHYGKYRASAQGSTLNGPAQLAATRSREMSDLPFFRFLLFSLPIFFGLKMFTFSKISTFFKMFPQKIKNFTDFLNVCKSCEKMFSIFQKMFTKVLKTIFFKTMFSNF